MCPVCGFPAYEPYDGYDAATCEDSNPGWPDEPDCLRGRPKTPRGAGPAQEPFGRRFLG